MKKKAYQAPLTRTLRIQAAPMLEGSTEELSFDPNDSTNDALSKDDDDWSGSVWDD